MNSLLNLFSLICLLGISMNNGLKYDETLAKRMVYFSGASYCGDMWSSPWKCQACDILQLTSNIIDVYSFKSTFLSGYKLNGIITYDQKNNAITISFAGTDPLSLTDWITNLSFGQKDYPACKSPYWWQPDCSVHAGFYNSYMDIADIIYNRVVLLKQQYPGAKLEITGHSLGGALALHCALDLKINHDISFQADYIYAIGSPRIGDGLFSDFFYDTVGKGRTFRITHDEDPVPLVPMESVNYEHVPLEIYYPNESDGEYIECDGSGEDHACINGNYWFVITDLNVGDHLNYLGYDYNANACY